VAVTADGSASTDPQGQVLRYAFDFGDGSSVVSQSTAVATHTYAAAGSFVVTLTVTNTSGLTSAARSTVTVARAPAYVAQLGTSSASTNKNNAFVTVGPVDGVAAGSLVLVTLQLSKPAAGSVAVTDAVGNSYAIVQDISTTAGRLVVAWSATTKALLAGQKITATFPKAAAYRLVAAQLDGVRQVDQSAAAAGAGNSFSSGQTATTTSSREVVIGVVALFTATGTPTWSSGWTDLPALAVGADYLGRAYQLPKDVSTFGASGTSSGSWLATTITFRP